MGNVLDLSKISVVKAAPTAGYIPCGDEAVFERLSGATIVQIGAPACPDQIAGHLEGGGLVLDYKIGNGPIYRLVFTFNENGMRIAFDNFTPSPSV